MNEIVQYSISPEMLADFESLVGFELQSVDAAQRVAAGYAARSMLTPFLIFTGVILILFVQPPFASLLLLRKKHLIGNRP